MPTDDYIEFTSSGAPLFSLRLHRSLYKGLVDTGALPRGAARIDSASAQRLDDWANAAENPAGQRAALVRALAELLRVANLDVRLPVAVGTGGFWDALAR